MNASRAVLDGLPDAALVPIPWVRGLLEDSEPEPAEPIEPQEDRGEPSWRVRLWEVPSETRLGVAEVAEALGRPPSYIYARTGPKAEDRIPHRKMDGTLLFTAGELRAWIRSHEVEVVGGPMEAPCAPR